MCGRFESPEGKPERPRSRAGPVKGMLLLAAALAAMPGRAQPAGASPVQEPPACDGLATIVLLGVPPAARYEIDLRLGKPPGSVKLASVVVEGESHASFAGLCAGDHFFAYRMRGESDYSLSGVMQSKASAGRVSQIGTRVRVYPMPAGMGTNTRKTKASEL